ncbi:MAG TPA: glycoside hydrolase family 88 protein [Chitinivibrionales bacterium]|nr:glycoside hydrolase family 88 protein [Chitinivibrionales bacterium]
MKSITLFFVVISFPIIIAPAKAYPDEFAPDSIIGITKRVAYYHMKSGPIYPNSWDGGAYMTGVMAMHRLTKDSTYLNFARQWAIKFKWMPCVTLLTTSADDICCCQTYCEIYLLDPRPANDSMIANVKTNLENLFYTVKQQGIWSWDDALYMAPPAVSRYCRAINNNEFIDSMAQYWWTTSANLYDTNYHLWYRDGGFKTQKAANGQPVFWSCGVAWVLGGMTRVLRDMPLDHPQRPKWEKQFREMAAAIMAEQGFNSLYSGLWTTSMRDHTQFPDPETSASAFFCFGMAWGINNHLLDSAQYIDCVKKAWRDLVANVGTDGRLQRCENVSDQPASIDVNNSSVEGEGAFMQAGEQMWMMATGATAAAAVSPANNKALYNTVGSRIIISAHDGAITIPKDASGAALFDLSGKLVLDYTELSGKTLRVPKNLSKNKAYVLKCIK